MSGGLALQLRQRLVVNLLFPSIMACSSLVIRLPASGNSYVFSFDKDITISDLLMEIRTKIPEANVGNRECFVVLDRN